MAERCELRLELLDWFTPTAATACLQTKVAAPDVDSRVGKSRPRNCLHFCRLRINFVRGFIDEESQDTYKRP
ncbi:hypothetical protein FOCC_FOCC011778 [Frankliniella occidentalis]|nr:hypothetical protein FOCC_FOCC011778 [Frankliniella occidentalis]